MSVSDFLQKPISINFCEFSKYFFIENKNSFFLECIKHRKDEIIKIIS